MLLTLKLRVCVMYWRVSDSQVHALAVRKAHLKCLTSATTTRLTRHAPKQVYGGGAMMVLLS